MSIRTLRARLERAQSRAGANYVIGENRERDGKRREELFHIERRDGLAHAQAAEKAKFDTFYEKEDRDLARRQQLSYKDLAARFGWPALTDAERIEYTELKERYPSRPDPRFKEMAEHFGAIARSTTDDEGRNEFECERPRPPAAVDECVRSEANSASTSGCPAPTAAENLHPASPDEISDAKLLEQLMLAANHNVVSGEGIKDIGPIRVMLQNGIVLDDVLYTLRQKVDRRIYPKNRALTSWSEHCFVLAVAEAYGRRVMLPVLKEKLKEKREALGKSA